MARTIWRVIPFVAPEEVGGHNPISVIAGKSKEESVKDKKQELESGCWT